MGGVNGIFETVELVDCHTHTVRSGHGEGTVEELVAAAERAGITTLAVTEHMPLPESVDPDHGFSMPACELGDYLSEIATAAERHPALEVVPGFEADWRPGCEDFLISMMQGAKVVLGSVHMLADGWCFDDPSQRDGWSVRGNDKVWAEYFELWMSMCESRVPFTTMAHPDLPKKFGMSCMPSPSFDLQGRYREAASLAAERDVLVEVNTSGWRKDVAEQYPSLDYLRCFHRAGVGCTVGSDAHSPTEVGIGIHDAYVVMAEAGYDRVTVIGSDGDRREIPLA